MAKNRKYQSAAIRFGPALKAFLLCLLIGGSGIGYVWQKNQIYELGQQIRKREMHLKEVQDGLILAMLSPWFWGRIPLYRPKPLRSHAPCWPM